MTRNEALDYHAGDRPGKIEVKETKPCLSPREVRAAYLPGALEPARAIAASWVPQICMSVISRSTRS